jgi:hypothetical protein
MGIVIGTVGLAVAVVTAWFAYRQTLPPKREIAVGVLPPVPLLADPQLMTSGVEVTRDGRTLTDPHIVTVTIRNTGRHDVTSASFHEGVPLVVDLGVPVEVVQVTERPSHATPLLCSVSGNAVHVGPGLISRSQEVIVQLLAEGRPDVDPPRVSHSLVDVRVAVGPGAKDSDRRPFVWMMALAGIMIAIASIGLLLVYGGRRPAREYLTSSHEPFLYVTSSAVPRGGDVTIVGLHLPAFCPVEVRAFQHILARDQTDEDGQFEARLHIAKDAPLGEAVVFVSCRDALRSADFRTLIAVVRATPTPPPLT